jgi:CheY-like chemotaxis protein
MNGSRILLVDDLPDVCTTLSGFLRDYGYHVRPALSRAEALRLVETEPFDVAILDVRLDESDDENQDGLLLMHEIGTRHPAMAIIILTGYATVRMVQEALQPDVYGRAPAFGFLRKEDVCELPRLVEQAIAYRARVALPSVHELVAQGEGERLEFKSSIRWDYRQHRTNKDLQQVVAKEIAGMMNGTGGTLVIGVADDGSILGIERDLATLRKQNSDGFELALTDIVKTYLGIEYKDYVHPRFERVGDKLVCVVSIQKSPEPVFLAKGDTGKLWVRTGNSTHGMDLRTATNYIQMHWKDA